MSSPRLLAVCLAALALLPVSLRADTTFDSGTTTISTGTNFGTNLYVGYSGTATMEVVAGGDAQNSFGYVGYREGSVGFSTVTGGTWATSNDFFVGYYGTGSLDINGGYVTDALGFIGTYAGSVGVVTVTGGTWASSVGPRVGEYGVGTLNVNGGYVVGSASNIGTNPFGIGTATVTSGTWASSNILYVGYDGTATLNVLGTGVVTVGGTLSQGAKGTINMESGGALSAAQVLLSNTTTFTGDPSGTGFGTITAASTLTYGGVLGLNFGKLYDEGSYSLFSFASLTPSGSFASLFSTGTGAGSAYDSISFTNDGFGLWAGTASNGQTLSFDEATGVLSFSAVPEPSAVVLGGIGTVVAWLVVRRLKSGSRLGSR